MRAMGRLILFIFFSVLLITQYQNCSSSAENTMFDSSASTVATTDTDPSKVTLTVKTLTSDLFVSRTDDQIQIGGICNTGNKLNNYIEYQLLNSAGVAVNLRENFGTGSASDNCQRKDTRCDARCENGRFFIVLRVMDPSLGGPTVANCQESFQLKMALNAYDTQSSAGFTNLVKYSPNSTFLTVEGDTCSN